MKGFKHTPGPWNWSHNSASDSSTACIDITPETEGGYRGSVANLQSCEHINGITMKETEANAHLIVAAPVLLEALKLAEEMLCKQENAMRSMGCYEPCPEVAILTARAAIAKALGETT